MFKTIRKCVQDRSGNVAILMSVSIGAISVLMFGGIQFNNIVTLRKGAQSAVDAATLTATLELGRGATEAEATDMALETFRANVATLPDGLDPQQVPTFSYRVVVRNVSVEADYTSAIDTPLNGFLGLPNYEANIQSSGFVSVPRDEITLVLDVSVSMKGAKFDALKTAASNFISIIDPHVPNDGAYRVVNLLPFSNRVNLGTDFEDLLAPASATHPRSLYEGCFEGEDPATQASDDNGIAGNLLPFEQRLQPGPNAFYCPPAASRALLASGDRAEILDRIDNFEIAYGTGTTHALSWGWRTLSPEWRDQFDMPFGLPRRFAPLNQKILILLTDGRILNFKYETNSAGMREFNLQPRPDSLPEFIEVCDQIAAQDELTVYTIGFDLAAADVQLRDALIDCATDDGGYFDADVADLTSVFATIAGNVSSARLTE